METVTIHSYNAQWDNAQIIATGTDSLTGERDVLIVRHPSFEQDTEYYAQSDEHGRHLNVGNNAFWMVRGSVE
jgi:hypothetical protein